MKDGKIENLHEKVLAGNLLTSGAGVAARVIDNFVSWLVAGVGAALALIIGNISEIEPYLSLFVVKLAVFVFLVAVVLTVVEKYLASVVMGAAESYAQAAEVGRRLAKDGVNVQFDVVFAELKAATLPPMRWLVGRSIEEVQEGDFAASGRKFARRAQWQGLLAIVVALLLLGTIGLVAYAIGG